MMNKEHDQIEQLQVVLQTFDSNGHNDNSSVTSPQQQQESDDSPFTKDGLDDSSAASSDGESPHCQASSSQVGIESDLHRSVIEKDGADKRDTALDEYDCEAQEQKSSMMTKDPRYGESSSISIKNNHGKQPRLDNFNSNPNASMTMMKRKILAMTPRASSSNDGSKDRNSRPSEGASKQASGNEAAFTSYKNNSNGHVGNVVISSTDQICHDISHLPGAYRIQRIRDPSDDHFHQGGVILDDDDDDIDGIFDDHTLSININDDDENDIIPGKHHLLESGPVSATLVKPTSVVTSAVLGETIPPSPSSPSEGNPSSPPTTSTTMKSKVRNVLVVLVIIAVGVILVIQVVGFTRRSSTSKGDDRDAYGADIGSGPSPAPSSMVPKKTIKLQLSHSSDNESYFQDPNNLEKRILHYSSILSGLQTLASREDMIPFHLLTGDAVLPNVFYEASAEVPELGDPGIADILMFDAMNVNGFVLGGQSLSGGIDEFATMINRANFPILSANYDFSNVTLQPGTPNIEVGEDASDCSVVYGKVVRSCYYDYGDIRIGLVGTTAPDIFDVITGGAESIPGVNFFGGFDPETGLPLVPSSVSILEQVDKLQTQAGAKIIILLDREGNYLSDPYSAIEYHGIDIIATQSSPLELAALPSANGPFNYLREGDTIAIPEYPIVREDSRGNSVLVVPSRYEYSYITNLIAEFDMDGNLVGWDRTRSGPIATTEEAVALFEDFLDVPELPPSEEVLDLFNTLSSTPSIKAGFTLIGTTMAALTRPHGLSRETNLSRLIADAFLWGAQQLLAAPENDEIFAGRDIDIGFKNVGGIRDSILGPDIIRLSIQSVLAFNNKLTIVEITLDKLLAALENAVSANLEGWGRYPTVAGMEVVFDASRPALPGLESVAEPSRVKSIVLLRRGNSTEIQEEIALVKDFKVLGSLNQVFVAAAPDYLVRGGDQYASFATSATLLATSVGEQQLLEDYISIGLGGTVDMDDPPARPSVVKVQ